MKDETAASPARDAEESLSSRPVKFRTRSEIVQKCLFPWPMLEKQPVHMRLVSLALFSLILGRPRGSLDGLILLIPARAITQISQQHLGFNLVTVELVCKKLYNFMDLSKLPTAYSVQTILQVPQITAG